MALAAEQLRYLRAHRGPARKCLVLDLDDTLWGGVVGEDGPDGVALGGDPLGKAHVLFQREVVRLQRRGVLLAICSRNNEADALAVFETRSEMLLHLDDFAAVRINWSPKPENVLAIATELDIGLDSVVFWDDSPAERARMRAALPQVLTPEVPSDPALLRQALVEMTVFDSLALTGEDMDRTRFYAEQAVRRRLEDSHRRSGRLDDYLADLRTVVEIAPATRPSLPRVAQLIAKTNQFNLVPRRLTEAEVEGLHASGRLVHTLRVADRFGDSGLVGVAIAGPSPARAAVWEIDVLLLSCRVIGRRVESALLHRLAQDARDAGATRLVGRYVATERNRPARDCYRDHGFRRLSGDPAGGGELWELDLEKATVEVPRWLEVRNLGRTEAVRPASVEMA
jgi:FkbH-like protein